MYPSPTADAVTTLNQVPLRPLTRVRYSAAAVKRVEDDLRQARLRHYETIMEAREAGHTLAQIGLALGVTRARVAQLIAWGKKVKEEPK